MRHLTRVLTVLLLAGLMAGPRFIASTPAAAGPGSCPIPSGGCTV